MTLNHHGAYRTTLLVVGGVVLVLCGCRKQQTTPTLSPEQEPPKVFLHLDGAREALKAGDIQAANLEIRGAQGLLERQARRVVEEPVTLEEELRRAKRLETAAQRHASEAESLQTAKKGAEAAYHLETASELLKLASNRLGMSIRNYAEGNFPEYYHEKQELQRQYQEGKDSGRVPGCDKCPPAEIETWYQGKLAELDKKWEAQRKEAEKASGEQSQEAAQLYRRLVLKRRETLLSAADQMETEGAEPRAKQFRVVARADTAAALESVGDFQGAEEQLEQLLKLDPQNRVARESLGRVLLRDNKPEGAVAQYALLVKQQPEDVLLRSQYASVLGQAGQWEKAATQYQALIEIDTKLLNAVSAEAEDADQQKFDLRNQMASHYMQLAGAHDRADQPESAREAYKLAIELKPDLKASLPEKYR